MALNLATERDVTGIGTICSPMVLKDAETLYGQFIVYAKNI